jgi:hypothetical protein
MQLKMRTQISFTLLYTLLSLSNFALALPSSSTTSISTLQTIYEFPNPTWVENLAVRSNGKILVTLLTAPEVWQIDPVSHTAELVYHFPDATGVSGIAEVEKDVFAVAVGNWSDITFTATFGSYSIWSIDVNAEPQVYKITDMPEAQFLNGMTVLPTQPYTVLVGDSDLGVIWRVNTRNRVYGVAIDNPDLKPNTSAALELGVNGIHYRDGYVYFVNVSLSIYVRQNCNSHLLDIRNTALLSDSCQPKWISLWTCAAHLEQFHLSR